MERLSGMDSFFLYAETPTQHMHVTLTAVLDPARVPGGYSFEHFKRHIAGRLHLVPPLTRRLVTVPLRLHHPLWATDPDFDVDQHVLRAAAPAPGGPRELSEVVAQIASLPLDRSRPLWEMWLIEGLADGQVGFVAKLHHATLDGVGGVEHMVSFFDLAAEPDEGPEAADEPDATTVDADLPAPEQIPTDLELVAFAAGSRLRGLVDVVPLLRRTAGSVLAVRRHRSEPDSVAGATPLTGPTTSINGSIAGRRKVAVARVSLDDVKTVKAAVGGTVNDVVLAVCAGALRSHLLAHGDPVDQPLVAACPVNVRGEGDVGTGAGNRLSAMFTPLHTELADPLDRLRATTETAGAAKQEHALFDPATLTSIAEVVDPNLFTWVFDWYTSSGLADRHRPAINLMVSNVPGPPFPLYLAGAELVRAFPMGPIIEGVGLNITVMSYRDAVDVGFMAAANLVPDVWDLADQVAPALDALLARIAPES
ncbi:MAG: wax ester/triacylglycerol synthase family O-acyltransferase [Acidimicrobiales bacterium]